MRPLGGLVATILKTKRSTRARHINDFRSSLPGRRRVKATMNGKFESTSKNYDESNLNRLPCKADELIDGVPHLAGGERWPAAADIQRRPPWAKVIRSRERFDLRSQVGTASDPV